MCVVTSVHVGLLPLVTGMRQGTVCMSVHTQYMYMYYTLWSTVMLTAQVWNECLHVVSGK